MSEYCEVGIGGRIIQLTRLEIILTSVRNSSANGNVQAQKIYDWLLSEEPVEEFPVVKATLIVGEELTLEEWDAKFGRHDLPFVAPE
jgi:hypothetical protein